MKRLLIAVIGFAIIPFTLTSCTLHWTKDVAKELQPNVLYESFKTKHINLKARSKCSQSPSVNIVNTEIRDENYLVGEMGANKIYINPKEMMNHIVDYMKDAFEKCRISVDNNSTNILNVSMKGAEFKRGFWAVGANIQLKIDIPERQYTDVYEAEEWTSTYHKNAMAYAIHVDTWKIINDPVIQDYILCR
ncbi:MAG: hypothetical protein NTY86_17555 [Deltaproteobacteria bacterium]|nr:hypothetical protein [Deltaproteobacteria bacterium]